jgi:membrane-associated PAP2 superfamily phosphatase
VSRLPTALRRDLVVSAVALVLLLAWDLSGADLAVARLFANAQGFTWRDAWWAATLLHDGGRIGAWVVLAALIVGTLRTPKGAQPGRGERWFWIGVMLGCVLLVPALKRVSSTSCPWELAEFGGVARHVSHWAFGVRDGGPGHCFPSGHAVAAFGFFGTWFLWRDHDRGRARRWLAGVCAVGLLFGTAQLARGAHYPSHTLWSAWLCWVLCVAAAAAQSARRIPAQAQR